MDLQIDAMTRGLEAHFRHVQHTRMADLPILNAALSVQCVGFHHTPTGCLGVLVTPWFVSLLLLPCEGSQWQDLPIGSVQRQTFASGSYAFTVAYDEGIGRYLSCSLLSPVFEFDDQESAVAFAVAALNAVDDPAARDTDSDARSAEIIERWHTDDGAQAGDVAAEQEIPAAPRTLSRRAFLRGGREPLAENEQ